MKKILFAVCDGWDECNSVMLVFETIDGANKWAGQANIRSPGRFNVRMVGTYFGYELSSDYDIKYYSDKYI